MNESALFQLVLFDPENTLITMFNKQGINFRRVPVTQKFVVATDETVEVLSNANGNILVESISLIFAEWLKEKQYRKLQAQLVDGSIAYIDELDVEAASNIIRNSMKISAFDPEYNNRILNK